jgi:curved DNA-binding protein CbpA
VNTDESLYDILGITKDATEEEIKKAYRKRAQETHPDVKGSAEEFSYVNEAYTILSDKKARLIYDRSGRKQGEKNKDQLRTEAIREIQRVMVQVLDDSDDTIFFSNLPEHILRIFNANIERCKSIVAETRKKIKRLRRYKQRFHYKKGDDNNFIQFGIEGQVYHLSTSISVEIQKIRQFELMLELLAEYDWEPESIKPSFGLKTVFDK